jgi:hypothetical protein
MVFVSLGPKLDLSGLQKFCFLNLKRETERNISRIITYLYNIVNSNFMYLKVFHPR